MTKSQYGVGPARQEKFGLHFRSLLTPPFTFASLCVATSRSPLALRSHDRRHRHS